jgi:hypothetical protein
MGDSAGLAAGVAPLDSGDAWAVDGEALGVAVGEAGELSRGGVAVGVGVALALLGVGVAVGSGGETIGGVNSWGARVGSITIGTRPGVAVGLG